MKKSELKDYVKEQIVDVLSTEAQDDRIGNPKFGPAPMEFQTMRDTLGDKKMLDRIQMLNVNDLEELLNALTFVVQKEASEEDIKNQKAYNDELEKTNDLMSKMKMEEDEEAPDGDKEVQAKASKQDKIIRDKAEKIRTITLNPNLNPVDLTVGDTHATDRDTSGLFMADENPS